MNVQLSEEDIKAVGRLEGAVSLPDGSGYIGTLNVYHELHCVVSVAVLASADAHSLTS